MTKSYSEDVRSDCTSYLRFHTGGVGIHHPVPVRHDIEKMADRRVANPIDVKLWRLWKSALDHHAVSAAGAVVAFGANGVETFAAANHKVAGQFYRQLRYIPSIRLPGIKRCILARITAGNSVRGRSPRIGSIREKIAFRKGCGFGLIRHIRATTDKKH